MKLNELVKGQEYAVKRHPISRSRWATAPAPSRCLLLDDKLWHLARPRNYTDVVIGPGRYKGFTDEYSYETEMGLIMAEYSPHDDTWHPRHHKVSMVQELWSSYAERMQEETRLKAEAERKRVAAGQARNAAKGLLNSHLSTLNYPGTGYLSWNLIVETTEQMTWLNTQLSSLAALTAAAKMAGLDTSSPSFAADMVASVVEMRERIADLEFELED